MNGRVCTHAATRQELMPQGHTHYARESCVICGHFLRWIAKPETLEARRFNAYRNAKLSMMAGLSPWERSFLKSIGAQKKWSPRQHAYFDRIAEKYLERVVS
jgi:hypothetical protein